MCGAGVADQRRDVEVAAERVDALDDLVDGQVERERAHFDAVASTDLASGLFERSRGLRDERDVDAARRTVDARSLRRRPRSRPQSAPTARMTLQADALVRPAWRPKNVASASDIPEL